MLFKIAKLHQTLNLQKRKLQCSVSKWIKSLLKSIYNIVNDWISMLPPNNKAKAVLKKMFDFKIDQMPY